ncbi:MAG: DUF4040 domain-containing protein, partial [Rhodococcus sp.]|nr:DUF4040 domain-containing protein [Rhodococcus sp. (in: high G+C Gram-positive bacteria)]
FVSKENLYGAYIDAPGPAFMGVLVGAVAVCASILTFAYSFRIVYGAFGGRTTQPRLHDPSIAFRVPAAIASLAGLILGIDSGVLAPLIDQVALDTQGSVGHVYLTLWHGFTPALGMSLIAISCGTVLFLQRTRVDRLLDRELFPVRGVDVFERIHASVIVFGARVGGLTRTQSPTRHLALPVLVLVGVTAAFVVSGMSLPPIPVPVTEPIDWLLLALVTVGVLGVVTTASRLAALALLGVVGFAVALVFFVLGAPDVGLTQLLVEVLTVVVAVLVLRRLPVKFRTPSAIRRNLAAVVAVVVGAVAALGTYALTGRRERSPAADYFIAETEAETGGTNIVNTILVDFRALDTLGELTVLGIAGLVVVGVVQSVRMLALQRDAHVENLRQSVVGSAVDNTILARTVGRWLTPVLIVLSLYLLLRGHYDPGGGFISALVGGAAFALAYLSAPNVGKAPIRLPYVGLICAGIAVGTAVGLLGYIDGGFLTPLHVDIPLPWGGYYHFTTVLIFDIGVYLAVVGIVLASLNKLGSAEPTRHVGAGTDATDSRNAPTGGTR